MDSRNLDSHDTTANKFLAFSRNRLQAASKNVNQCVDRLTHMQIWQRSGDWENSVGNLVLHLEGNVRQFVLHAVAEQPDKRDREQEFSLVYQSSREELLGLFNGTLTDVCEILNSLAQSELTVLTDPHTVGWSVMTKLECIYHAVGHFQLHTGQIIYRTKQLLEADLDLSLPRPR